MQRRPGTKKVIVAAMLFPVVVHAAPSCVVPNARNIVLANAPKGLGVGGKWLLQNVDNSKRIILERCRTSASGGCYFATNVEPGKYYFQEVLTSVKNQLHYPVARKGLWFEISGKGVDYIGEWTIDRGSKRERAGSKVHTQSPR